MASPSDKSTPYPDYRPSGVQWLGDVPAHWEVRRLRNLVEMRASNVDKHTRDGEQAVRLCNYLDVYKHDSVGPEIDFMPATATADEIDRFTLATGDVLVTKDSEDWTDIGVPAVVECVPDGVLCGYHLALLRPRSDCIQGKFLLRTLQTKAVASQFHIRANGVTRYGLSQDAIKSTWLAVPPLSEQTAIIRFLDHATDLIDRYIRSKEKLVALLEEQKQAMIHEAVTGQIDVRTGRPYPGYKPSSGRWLGKLPITWRVLRSKFVLNEVNARSLTGEETPLSMSQVFGLVPSDLVERTLTAASHVGGKLCDKDDLVLNRLKAHLGVFAVARQSGIVSPDYTVFRARGPAIVPFLELVLRLPALRTELRARSRGIVEGFWRLYTDDFFDIFVPIPPSREQAEIVEAVSKASEHIDAHMEGARRAITLLNEYRARLIADVVTGKLDVRGTTPALLRQADLAEA